MQKRLTILAACLVPAFIMLFFSVPTFATECGGVETSLIECDNGSNGVWAILAIILNILTLGVGILGTIGIIISGMQYMASSGDITATTKAKKRLANTVLGLAIYGVMFVFIQWLLPGGIFINSEEVQTVAVGPLDATVYIGESKHFAASVSPVDAKDISVTWTSSDENVATVDKRGNVYGKTSGTATITATSANGVTASTNITVEPRPANVKPTNSDGGGSDDSSSSDSGGTQSGDGTKPIEPLNEDSSNISCASGTEDLGVANDAYIGGNNIKIRLCAIPTISGTSKTYNGKTTSYIAVNSRVSGAYQGLGQRYADTHSGQKLSASESYRTNAEQEYFWNCYQTGSCNNGNLAARPGTSNHQGGLAVDLSGVGGWGSTMSNWLKDNSPDFGLYRNLDSEPWHMSHSGT